MLLLWIGCALFAAVCGLAFFLARVAERGAKLSLHRPLRSHGAYVRYMRDKHELNGLGIAQQLTRHMGAPSSFGLAFSSLPLIGGALFLLGPAIAAGGPAVIGVGWPIVGLFGLLTACSVAAYASAVPTAGGCYHWALAASGRRAGLWSGWLHTAGSALLLITTNVWLADWSCRTIERLFGSTGGAGLYYTVLTGLFASQAAVAARAMRGFGRVLAWSAAVQLLLPVAIVALLAAQVWHGDDPFQALGLTAADLSPAGEGGGLAPALLGFVLLQRLFLGLGEGAQAGEETNDPRVTVPWSVFLSAAALALLGFVLFAFIAMHARNGAGGPVPQAAVGDWLVGAWERLGSAAAALFFALAAAVVWAGGTTTLASVSKTLFAMARDESAPFAAKLAAVSMRHRWPVWATLAAAAGAGLPALAFALAVPRDALPLLLPQLVLAGIAAMHAAYVLPIGGRLKETLRGQGAAGTRKRSRLKGPWELGKYGAAVDAATACWLAGTGLTAVCLLKPAALLTAAAVLLATAIGIERRHRALRRKSPLKIVGSMRFSRKSIEECIRIERKFPQ
ncbi:Amino acid transporter [Paenibacillus sp. UNC496MF]|uniref:amino acid permease n=1 Tax=Paenibacillus sp. UNC496MF TaxID=1502753 RepID=UPI0008EB9C86|nr:amino acid permease [Paenibacillus sp. UNC496MF]SFI32885.1 Amino acid transporter [Paenibacillus sp. UNC496MF]